MQVEGKIVDVVIKDSRKFQGTLHNIFQNEYFEVKSEELPVKLVIHRSWIKGKRVILPEDFSLWLSNQLQKANRLQGHTEYLN
jgi:hypothetical protein